MSDNKRISKDILPAVNWLVHVLNNKVKDPIGTELFLGKAQGGSSDNHKVTFDSEYTFSLFLEMAKLYTENEKKLNYIHREDLASKWNPASEPPDNSLHLSVRFRRILVTSPALLYVVPNGVGEGFYSLGDGFYQEGWYVVINGKAIRHDVTHWRFLPPSVNSPELPANYETVKEEVERLKKESRFGN